LANEGIGSGELIPVESSQLIYAVVGPNVFYFLSAPMMRLIRDSDAFDPPALAFRRKAAVEFLAQAIFMDRKLGGQLAAGVLADTPMPQYSLNQVPGLLMEHQSVHHQSDTGGKERS